MTDPSNQTPEKPSLTFTLVHGTFARNAPWVVDDDAPGMFRSKLRAELEKDGYDVHFEVVPWGDESRVWRYLRDNTICRRLFGVEQLKQHLGNCGDATPINRRYIVAHSHGGNIALCALNQPELIQKVTGVICMSSPFLRYRPVYFSRELLVISAFVLLMHTLAHQGFSLWAYTVFYLFVVLTLIVFGNFGQSNKSLDEIINRLAQLTFVGKEHFIGHSGRLSFLAIRPHRDEVTLLFLISRGIGDAFRWLWEILNKFGRWVAVIIIILVNLEMIVEQLPPALSIDFSGLQGLMSLVDQSIGTPLLLIMTAVLTVVIVMRWSFAFDSLPWVASIGVESEIVPWDDAQKEPVDTFGGFQHTHVQNQSPPVIAKYLREGRI